MKCFLLIVLNRSFFFLSLNLRKDYNKMLVGLKRKLGIRQNKLFPHKNTFNKHKPTYQELQTGSILLLNAVVVWLSELQWCELYTKKHKSSCLFKQNLLATNIVGTNSRWVSNLTIIGSAFVWSEELGKSRWITPSEIRIIL